MRWYRRSYLKYLIHQAFSPNHFGFAGTKPAERQKERHADKKKKPDFTGLFPWWDQ